MSTPIRNFFSTLAKPHAGDKIGFMRDLSNQLPFPIAELKRKLGRGSYDKVWRLIKGWDQATAETAIAIERATGGRIDRSDLRPDLWDPRPGA